MNRAESDTLSTVWDQQIVYFGDFVYAIYDNFIYLALGICNAVYDYEHNILFYSMTCCFT